MHGSFEPESSYNLGLDDLIQAARLDPLRSTLAFRSNVSRTEARHLTAAELLAVDWRQVPLVVLRGHHKLEFTFHGHAPVERWCSSKPDGWCEAADSAASFLDR